VISTNFNPAGLHRGSFGFSLHRIRRTLRILRACTADRSASRYIEPAAPCESCGLAPQIVRLFAANWRSSEKPKNPRCKPAGFLVVRRIVSSEKPNDPRCEPAGFTGWLRSRSLTFHARLLPLRPDAEAFRRPHPRLVVHRHPARNHNPD
jgi:hypothetical protein